MTITKKDICKQFKDWIYKRALNYDNICIDIELSRNFDKETEKFHLHEKICEDRE